MISMGLATEPLEVWLAAGGDFVCTLRTDDESNWPGGTNITLLVGALTWTATVAGMDATFSVDKSVTDTVTARTPAKLIYTNGSTDTVWAVGMVVRRDG